MHPVRLVSFAVAVVLALAGTTGESPGPTPVHRDTVITVTEATALSFDLTADGRGLILDLLGGLWELPVEGGTARRLTDPVAEQADDRQPAVAPGGVWIATRSDRPEGRGIWIHSTDGRTHRQLTDSALILGDDVGLPAWAPGGGQLAFARQGAVFRVSSDSGRPIRLAVTGVNGGLDEPDWHPDGRRLALSGPWRGGTARALLDGPAGASIWEVDLDSGAARRLTPEGTAARAPAWHPNGSAIAYFAGDSSGAFRLEVRATTGVARIVASEPGIEPRRVRWSRDGRSLFYVASGRLRRVAVDGGPGTEIPFQAELRIPREPYRRAPVRFPEPGTVVTARGYGGVALSPDGTRIAMLALGRLWLIDREGTARSVASVPPWASQLIWHPAGREVGWIARGDSAEDIFATDVTTGATRAVSALPGEEARPAWSPDGRWIAFYHWPKSGSRSPPWSPQDSETWLRIADARLGRPILQSDTRVLSEIDWGEISAYASPLQWMPEGGALLAFGGAGWPVAGRDCAQAVLFQPDSVRHPVEHFPCRPGHLVVGADSALVAVERGELVRYRPTRQGWSDRQPLGTGAALAPSLARDGTLLYVGPDGLRLRDPAGRERTLGWPVRYTVPEPEPLLLRNLRLVPLEPGSDTGLRDVLLEWGRIRRIAPAGSLRTTARVMDAAGRWAIPGLIDVHGHLGDGYAPLRAALYHGVTVMREMWHPLGDAAAARDAVNAGAATGARVVVSGPPIYPTPAGAPLTSDFLWISVDSTTADRAVAMLRAFGAGHVKMRYVQGWSGVAGSLIRSAHRHGLSVSGHCAHALPLVAAGIDGQEHLDGQCGDWEFGVRDDLVLLYRAAGITVTPVIDYHDQIARVARDTSLLHAPDVEPFLTPALRLDAIRQNVSALLQRIERRAARARAATRMMYRAGVRIGLGTDAHMYPGGIARELEALVAAGLTPGDALRAATIDAAAVIGTDQVGRIAEGYLADLVLLDADPLDAVGNVRRIHSVIQGGRIIDRVALLESR